MHNLIFCELAVNKYTRQKITLTAVINIDIINFNYIMKNNSKEVEQLGLFFNIKRSGTSIDHIVVGLGNPGDKYADTRHNVGFSAIDFICRSADVDIRRLKHYAYSGKGNLNGKNVLFLKPQTFMNSSGKSVHDAASFYKVDPSKIIVLFDDVTLDAGALRIRRKGSDGGHNGIKSICEYLGTSDFPRIKIGVGQKPHPEYDLADWVLSKPARADADKITKRFPDIYDALLLMLNGETDKAMNKYN